MCKYLIVDPDECRSLLPLFHGQVIFPDIKLSIGSGAFSHIQSSPVETIHDFTTNSSIKTVVKTVVFVNTF